MRKKKYCHFCGSILTERLCDGRMRLFCRECNEPVYENPVPANCIVLVDKTGRLLLVKRSIEPKKGHWCLPGGFIELEETPEKSALRELKEETGLVGKIEMLLGVVSTHSPQYNTVLMLSYLIKDYSGVLTAGDDADDADFFHIENLPEIAFESHLRFIRMYFCAYAV